MVLLVSTVLRTVLTESFNYGLIYSDGWGEDWTKQQELGRGRLEKYLLAQGYLVQSEICVACPPERALQLMMEWNQQQFNITYATSNTFSNVVTRYMQLGLPMPILGLGSMTVPLQPGFFNIYGRLYQGSYLAGIACGMATRTGHVSFIGKTLLPPVVAQVNAFWLGAKAVNPAITVHATFTNHYYHPLMERKAGEMMLNDFECDCSWGTSDALRPFVKRNYPGIGSHADSRYIIGPYVYFSVLYNWGGAYIDYTKQVIANGTLLPGRVLGGFESILDISNFSPFTPPEIKSRVYQEKLRLMTHDHIFCVDNKCPTDAELSKITVNSTIHMERNLTEEELISTLYVATNDTAGLTIGVIGLMVVICGIMILVDMFWVQRYHIIYRASAPLFCLVILLGCILGLATIFVWMGQPTNNLCNLRVWLTSLAFCLVYGGLVVKNWRIYRIFTQSQTKLGQKQTALPDQVLLLWGMAPIVVVEIVLLLIMTLAFPLTAQVTTTPVLRDDQQYLRCQPESLAGILTLLASNFLLVAYGGFLSWKQARDIPAVGKETRFRESWGITMIIVSTCFCLLFAIIIYMAVPYYDPFSEAIIIQVVHLLIFSSPTLALFLPKFLSVHFEFFQHSSSGGSTTRFTTASGGSVNKGSRNSKGDTSPRMPRNTKCVNVAKESPGISDGAKGSKDLNVAKSSKDLNVVKCLDEIQASKRHEDARESSEDTVGKSPEQLSSPTEAGRTTPLLLDPVTDSNNGTTANTTAEQSNDSRQSLDVTTDLLPDYSITGSGTDPAPVENNLTKRRRKKNKHPRVYSGVDRKPI